MKHKQAKSLATPNVEKTPRLSENPDAYLALNPSWRIGKVDLVDPFGWHCLDQDSIHRIRQKLSEFESMTWSEVLIKARKQNHPVPVSHFNKPARSRLAALALDDQEELLSLRLAGKERIWGILVRGVLTLLWWDPHHRVCPCDLKHT